MAAAVFDSCVEEARPRGTGGGAELVSQSLTAFEAESAISHNVGRDSLVRTYSFPLYLVCVFLHIKLYLVDV